eukprot:Rhum_TRINITY_DN14748_c14_g1::Rhum_TRINITY_DN14748_c14_g1_i3::g.114715::m.114715
MPQLSQEVHLLLHVAQLLLYAFVQVQVYDLHRHQRPAPQHSGEHGPKRPTPQQLSAHPPLVRRVVEGVAARTRESQNVAALLPVAAGALVAAAPRVGEAGLHVQPEVEGHQVRLLEAPVRLELLAVLQLHVPRVPRPHGRRLVAVAAAGAGQRAAAAAAPLAARHLADGPAQHAQLLPLRARHTQQPCHALVVLQRRSAGAAAAVADASDVPAADAAAADAAAATPASTPSSSPFPSRDDAAPDGSHAADPDPPASHDDGGGGASSDADADGGVRTFPSTVAVASSHAAEQATTAAEDASAAGAGDEPFLPFGLNPPSPTDSVDSGDDADAHLGPLDAALDVPRVESEPDASLDGSLNAAPARHKLDDDDDDGAIHVSSSGSGSDSDSEGGIPHVHSEGELSRHASGGSVARPPTFNEGALVVMESGCVCVDVRKLFFDDCSSQGNCFNKYLGHKDMRYWHSRYAFGVTSHTFNSLASPLGCIGQTSAFRLRCVQIVDSKWFSRFIITAIMLNALTLAVDAAAVNEDNDDIDLFLIISEYTFLAIYTIEAALKICAMGFFNHSDSYLVQGVRKEHRIVRRPNWWNLIDFVIVVLAWVSLHPQLANVNVIRALRLLRPLKALHSVEGLQIILKALLSSLGPLANVVVLLLFFMIIFAITGVLLWEGKWHQRCYVDTEHLLRFGAPDTVLEAAQAGAIGLVNSTRIATAEAWNDTADALAESALPSSPLFLPNTTEGRSLDPWWGWEARGTWHLRNYTHACTCVKYGRHCNIHDAGAALLSYCDIKSWRRKQYLNFDNTLTALLIIFKAISLDDWPDDMSIANDTVGQGSFVFFLIVTLCGSFFTMNLVLAVLCGDFADISHEIREEKKREKINADLAVYSYKVNLCTMHFGFMRLAIAVYGAGMQVPKDELAEESIERIASVFEAIKDSIDRSAALRSQQMPRRQAVRPPRVFCDPTQDKVTLPPVPILETEKDRRHLNGSGGGGGGGSGSGSGSGGDVVDDYRAHAAPPTLDPTLIHAMRTPPQRTQTHDGTGGTVALTPLDRTYPQPVGLPPALKRPMPTSFKKRDDLKALASSGQSTEPAVASPLSDRTTTSYGELLGKQALLDLIKQDTTAPTSDGNSHVPESHDGDAAEGVSRQGSLQSNLSRSGSSPAHSSPLKSVRIDEFAAEEGKARGHGGGTQDSEDDDDEEEEEEDEEEEEEEDDEATEEQGKEETRS